MSKMYKVAIFLFLSIIILSCQFDNAVNPAGSKFQATNSVNLIEDYPAIDIEGAINVLIEIPAGTIEKWEVQKSDGQLYHQKIGGEPRLINYLPYPGNYGMIPQTILSKETGGDGDPLDVIVLGPSVPRGEIVKCKIIGVLHLIDNNEKDDKMV